MIVLPIHQSSAEDDDTPQEWSLLELNGEVVPPKSHSNLQSDNMELGSIKLDEKGENATFIIASHELKGKVFPLKEPFVIMRPCKRPREDHINEEDVQMSPPINDNKKFKSGMEIAGIVRSKILFSEYPKSIMR